jgi:molybdopterin molybdotransferase
VAEFFTVRTVSDVFAHFDPPHRSPQETVAIDGAAGLPPVDDVRSPSDLPVRPRSAVDGYAVAASATHGASEGLPAYLRVVGAVVMGEVPAVAVAGDGVAEIPTGGLVPDGADAVVMVEHTAPLGDGRIELTRPAAPGDNVVAIGDDVRAGAVIARAGHPLRPQELGLMAAVGITEVRVRRRPAVAIVSTGDEVVDAHTEPSGAQVRDANSHALGALVRELGGDPVLLGIVPDDPAALRRICVEAIERDDVLVVSAGSSVGARDATADVVASLGEPGIWCHGLALKPGKPTLLADVGGKPVIGLPGNPVSALVVMRLVGAHVLRRVGGRVPTPLGSLRRALLDRNVASQTGRFDVVQVRIEDGRAVPLFGKASQLSIMTAADGWLTVPEAVGGLHAGAQVDVEVYR